MRDNANTFDFGARLRELREAKKLTPEQVAELTGISPSTINRYERNVQEPTKPYLIALAKAYNTSLDYMVGFENIPSFKIYDLNKRQQMVLMGFVKYFIDNIEEPESYNL